MWAPIGANSLTHLSELIEGIQKLEINPGCLYYVVWLLSRSTEILPLKKNNAKAKDSDILVVCEPAPLIFLMGKA